MNYLDHKHIIIRGYLLNPPRNAKLLEKDILRLIEDLDMEVLIAPRVVYSDLEGNRGITAIAGITTSHIAIHCWDEEDPALVEFDIYSCKDFDKDIAINFLRQFGLRDNYEMIELDRTNELKLLTKTIE